MTDQETWNSFVATAPGGSFLQSWEWGEMQAQLGVPYWRLTERNTGAALVVKRQLPWGKSWLYVPRGPISAASTTSKTSEASKTSSSGFTGLAEQLVSLGQKE